MNRSTLILGGAAIVLALLAVVLVKPGRDPLGRDRKATGSFLGLDASAPIDRVEIRVPGSEPTVLEESSTGWFVASEKDFPADTAAVSTLLRTVRGMAGGALVSRKPDRPEFELGTAAVEIAVSGGGRELTRFEVGKGDQKSYTSSYVRPSGKDEVYLVRGVNRAIFNRTQGFRDRTLASFAPEQVASLTVAAGDTGWTATNEDSLWTVSSPDGTSGKANETLVNAALRSFSAFAADGFADDADSLDTGLTAPEITVTVRLLSGAEQTVAIGGKNERGQRFAARPDRRAVYLIGEWRLNPFRRRAAEMVAAG